MIFFKLIETLRMHADGVEPAHIGLANFAAACH
jgi:hypothetical protein